MLISIVIPVYNGVRYLASLLTSLQDLELSGHELEIVVVDDGSTDESVSVARDFDVVLVEQENRGPAAARNAGWRKSRGDYILFTDSDCRPRHDWIVQMVKSLDDARVGAVAGSYDIVNYGSVLARVIHEEIMYRHSSMPRFIRAGGTYNLGVRRNILERIGGFDESFPTASGEDNDLSYRILDAGFTIAFNPESRVGHIHPEKYWKYMKSQMVHGFWRGRLYRSHPRFVSGDDYTRWSDIAATLLSVLSLGLLPPAVLFGSWFIRGFWLALAALFIVNSWWAALVAGHGRSFSLFPVGSAVFNPRSFYRSAGLILGILTSLARGRNFSKGVLR